MNVLKSILNSKKIIITIGVIIIIPIAITIYFINNNTNNLEILNQLEEETQENKKNTENVVQQEKIETEEEIIAIHITGEIKNAGLIYLKRGARIEDAIQLAGGATKNANLDKVNLAYILEDGQKIYIPSKKEKEQNEYIISNSGENVLIEEGSKNEGNITNKTSLKGENNKVNINSANQTELETLPGIGPSLAQRIIEYRKQNGRFQKIEDIQNVKGIGNSKYSNIKEFIII